MTQHPVSEATRAAIELVDSCTAHNYAPLPVVITAGSGAWVTDVDGRRYLDCLAAYSALNFGHGNPRFTEVAKRQLDRLTLTSRAAHSDTLGPFAQKLAKLAGKELVLPMNTGAEAVETAIKVARKWGRLVKGVPEGRGEIVAMHGNFHGRTTTIISFSDDETARADYGPFTPGFRLVDFGDAEALAEAITPETVAVLLEPIQGEAGIVVPPEGYLRRVRELTRERNVLMICDEVQTGMGRTGTTFRFQAEGVEPDLITVGKALGAGIVPLSAVIGDRETLGLLRPGQHGSTFGGNPLACAIGAAVCEELERGEYQRRSAQLGERLHAGLRELLGRGAVAVRGAGLWAGVDIDPALGTAKEVCLDLLERGILAKDTHGQTIRFAPPLVVGEEEIELILREFAAVLQARARTS